jgi:hypothetical protein
MEIGRFQICPYGQVLFLAFIPIEQPRLVNIEDEFGWGELSELLNESMVVV